MKKEYLRKTIETKEDECKKIVERYEKYRNDFQSNLDPDWFDAFYERCYEFENKIATIQKFIDFLKKEYSNELFGTILSKPVVSEEKDFKKILVINSEAPTEEPISESLKKTIEQYSNKMSEANEIATDSDNSTKE